MAFGSCACFGGVNQLKNRFKDPAWVKKEVYGSHPIETNDTARPLEDFVKVDLQIFGCPVKKEEVEKIVTNVVLGKSIVQPEVSRLHGMQGEREHLPLRPGRALPRADHPGRAATPGARTTGSAAGAAAALPMDANIDQMQEIMKKYGFSEETMLDRLECFGGFAGQAAEMRKSIKAK